ncbi:MAG: hypothetical protein JWP44_1251, partial [Mucilaginibacter sp.]|nr:hypothetical protein [Mucilaginibacter sp.]
EWTRWRIGKQLRVVLLFPSAVLTASGSKGISQHKAPLKFFVNVEKNLIPKKEINFITRKIIETPNKLEIGFN